jgi:hypothetical protein
VNNASNGQNHLGLALFRKSTIRAPSPPAPDRGSGKRLA